MRTASKKPTCVPGKSPIWILLLSIGLILITGLSACSGGSKPASIESIGGAPQGKPVTLSAIQTDKEAQPDGIASALYDFDASGTIDQPVTVTFPLVADAPKDDPDAKAMLGIGVTVAFESGSRETFYRYVEAAVADGQASTTFTPSDYTGGSYVRGKFNQDFSHDTPSGEHLSLGIFWCTTIFQNGGHFLVSFPSQAGKTFINYNDRVAFLNDLEGVHSDYLGKNFNYSQREYWPMEVNVQRLNVEGAYDYGSDGAQGEININRKFFQNGYLAAEVKPLLAHEFFHFVQFNYETTDTDNLWFDEATATYFESMQLGRMPSIVNEYKERIFTGVIPIENTSGDGYARAPMIQFLAKTHSDDFIRSAYELVKEGYSWEHTLASALGDPSKWAGDFYAALVKGQVGDYAPYTLHKTLAEGTESTIGSKLPLIVPLESERKQHHESDEDAVLGETTLNMNAYGAKLVALTIDDTNATLLEDSDQAVVRVSEGADVRVMAVHGKEVSEITRGEYGFPLEGLKNSLDNQMVYLVLVTGLHKTGQQAYKVSVVIPDSGNEEGATNDYQASRAAEIYNGYYTVTESFSVTADYAFTVVREAALPDTIAVQIMVNNRKNDVHLVLSANVSNPTFTAKLANLAKEGYEPKINKLYWKGSQGEVTSPEITVNITKGQQCGETYTYNMLIDHFNASSGLSKQAGSASVFQVSIGCPAPTN